MFDELNGLQVTSEHIALGVPAEAAACPVALAMKGVVEGTPKVYPKETVIHNDPITTWIHNTPELANWINRFDQGGYAYVPACLLYTSPSPRDRQKSRMPSSA